MRALITGGHGFVGRHLAQHLVSCGDNVAVTYLSSAPSSTADETAEKIALPTAAQSIALDVTDRDAVFEVISLMQPDAVYHLAALSFVPDGEKNPERIMQINTIGTMNLLDAIAANSADSKFLFVSSSEVYGHPRPGSLPLRESSELRPTSMYGVSKASADAAVFKYSYSNGVNAIRVRPFSHLGPGQSDQFAISSFAKQVAAVKLGKQEPVIKVGNLEVKRDYSDVSDIVRGYREALLNGKNGEAYNLCYGESVEIGELLRSLISLADIDVEVVEDPARVRTVDIPEMVGSYEKSSRDFGWRPRVEREAMLDSLLAFWLDALS